MQKAEAKTESFKKVVTYRKHIHYFWLSLRGEAVAISVLDNHDAARQVRRTRLPAPPSVGTGAGRQGHEMEENARWEWRTLLS